MRLGVYSDLVYRRDERGLSTHQAFIRFVTALPPRVDEVVLFGRLDPTPARSHYELPARGVRFVPLPFYGSVRALGGQASALTESLRIFGRELDRLDAVWIFGPHPMAVAFAVAARRRGVPLFLGVRQDYPTYIRSRLPSRRWAWAVAAAHALELAFRGLARRAATVTVGEELAGKYARGGGAVLSTGFSLVRRAELAPVDEALARPWEEPFRLLSVGRLAPEKNPLLLVDILARLRERGRRWTLVVAGDGPLAAALERRAAERGVRDALELAGYVASGPDLWRLYRSSDAFLHVSLTEGVPQVLWEAQAAGLPVVATAVGGVPAATGHGSSALLVPPRDAEAAADALNSLGEDEALRHHLVREGLANAERETMEAQLDRLASFFRAGAGGPAT